MNNLVVVRNHYHPDISVWICWIYWVLISMENSTVRMNLTQEIFHMQNVFSFHRNMNKYTAFFLMTPSKSLFLRNSIAKQDLNLQLVQIEDLPKGDFVQLKIYMDLDQICQVLSFVNMWSCWEGIIPWQRDSQCPFCFFSVRWLMLSSKM